VVILHILNKATGLDKRLFDLNLEQNLPTWVSSMQLFSVALGAVLVWRLEVRRTHLAWLVLAGVFAFLSLDELALLHEELVERVGDAWFWPLLYSPLAVAVLGALAVVAAEIRAQPRVLLGFVLGLGCLGAALVVDGAATQWVDVAWLFAVGVVVEESLELTGSALLVGAVMAVLLAKALEAEPGLSR
jgi:hypothetical protein